MPVVTADTKLRVTRFIAVTRRAFGIILSATVLIGAPLALLYYSQTKHAPSSDKQASAKKAAPLVRVVTASKADLTREIELTAPARSWWDIQVVSQMAGTVQKVMVDVGDRVAEGKPLAEIDTELIRARVREAEADLGVAVKEVERAKSLVKDAAGSQRRVEDAEAARSKAEARLAALRIEMKEYTIRVPGSDPKRVWTVVDRRIVAGDFAPQNQPLFQLSALGTIRLLVNVPEREVRWLREGTTSEVRFDALPAETFKGTLARIWPAGKEGTYTLPVEVHVDNSDARIRPGMLGRVRLELERHPGAVVVPADALLDEGDERAVVVVVSPEGVARHRKVKLGLRSGGRVEVVEGVREGERVVTSGAAGTKDGKPVTVVADGRSGKEGRP